MPGRRKGNRSRLAPAAALVTVALLFAGLVSVLPGKFGASATDPVLRVVATTTVFADLAANVAGEQALGSSLIPAGAEPPTREPSTALLRAVAGADVVLYDGLGPEPVPDPVIANLRRP